MRSGIMKKVSLTIAMGIVALVYFVIGWNCGQRQLIREMRHRDLDDFFNKEDE